jgi:alkanesulfonate monooxygenase
VDRHRPRTQRLRRGHRRSVEQVIEEILEYQRMGVRAFIFSGYPHLGECRHFGTKVLRYLKTLSLPHAYGRVPSTMPATPLGTGPRR